MTKFTKAQKELAHSHAIRYAAYRIACEKEDVDGALVWGEMCLETAEAIGLDLSAMVFVSMKNHVDMLREERYATQQAGE